MNDLLLLQILSKSIHYFGTLLPLITVVWPLFLEFLLLFSNPKATVLNLFMTPFTAG